MNFTLSRDRTVASKFGHAIAFKKGVPTYVPPACYEEVQAIGAIPETELAEPPPPAAGQPPSDPAERDLMLLAAIEQVVKAGQREQFSAGGAPHQKALSTILGWPVTSKERDIAWQKFRKSAND